MFGRKHSIETLEKLSVAKSGENNPCFGRIGQNNPMFGQTHMQQSKMSDSKKGSKNPMFCKPKVVGSGSPSQKISVLDKDKNQSTTYDSINAAARALNIPKSNINHFLANNPQKPYKGRYIKKKNRLIYSANDILNYFVLSCLLLIFFFFTIAGLITKLNLNPSAKFINSAEN